MFKRRSASNAQQQDYQGRGCGSSFGGRFSEKFANHFGGGAPWMNGGGFQKGGRKAANIEETETAFVVSLYAAGLNKSDFKISVADDVLSINYTAKEAVEQSKFIHQEYNLSSFNRSFQLNGKVLTENINAAYTDGVLKVTLHKNPETNKPGQEVPIN